MCMCVSVCKINCGAVQSAGALGPSPTPAGWLLSSTAMLQLALIHINTHAQRKQQLKERYRSCKKSLD